MTGYHATIVVRDPGGCPVAVASERADGAVDSVARSAVRGESTVVEEFGVRTASPGGPAVGAGPSAESPEDPIEAGLDVERVYETGGRSVYRFERDWSNQCVCEVVESSGDAPVSSIRAADGELHVSVHAGDVEALSESVSALKERFDGVRLQELTETGGDDSGSDLVLVDRARLTDRQREVLETAHELGYFEYPKGANAGEVAEAIGVSGSTFAEHLSAAQTKLLRAILEASASR